MALEEKIIHVLNQINIELRNQNKIEEFGTFLQNSKKIIKNIYDHINKKSNTFYPDLSLDLKSLDLIYVLQKIANKSNENKLSNYNKIINETINHYDIYYELLKNENIHSKYLDANKIDRIINKNIEIHKYSMFLDNSNIIDTINNNISNISSDLAEQKTFTKEISVTIDSIEQKTLTSIRDKFFIEFESNLKAANATKDQIEALLNKISTEIIARNYADTAKREKFLADNFRIFGILIALISIIYIAFFSNSNIDILNKKEIDHTLKYLIFLKPIFISILLMTISGFLFKESSKHRSQQQLNEQQAFRIDAMTPLLRDITIEQQIAIKHDVIKSMFSSEKQISIQDDTNNSINSLTQIIEKLIPEKIK